MPVIARCWGAKSRAKGFALVRIPFPALDRRALTVQPPSWNYPKTLPVVERRQDILEAIRAHQVVVVVSETGSGKTTQLPKMVAEAIGERAGWIGCTQPRRIAAASVAERVAEELECKLGSYVGYQVRFEDRTSSETRIKFMTDGILLAETQSDRELRGYAALILDEVHERSLNIDFLLGYLKELLPKRPDLKIVLSSATLDAGAFAEFFDGAPVVEAAGRTYPVEELFLPPREDEEQPNHVVRAVEWLSEIDPKGDVLVFLSGEREIRDCAERLDGRRFPNTEILPLFARLGLGDQQRVFHPGPKRRVILATNVAETSLTIPRIVSVVDSGLARISRWSPGRGVQRLQIEAVSQASARQRKGRCGRVREGICVRLYGEDELLDRPEFTDPEIRRSSLAGVILRMKSLGLPEIEEFPFVDPPAPKAISEGYRTLREVGALDREKNLTEAGRRMARMPIDPRLAKMVLAARDERCLTELLPIVAALETNDPRERPSEKQQQADAAHARWRDDRSDFLSVLRLWLDLSRFRENGRWRNNQLRKFAKDSFLNFRRLIEWANVHDELRELVSRELRMEVRPLAESVEKMAHYDAIHRALLAGVPRQFGLWDREERAYRSASGGFFAIFPGSGLFHTKKRPEWVLAMELVETTRLWARKVASIDPVWLEKVAPHLCRSRFSDAHWDEKQGAVYAKETVICGGLPIVSGRRVHSGRIDPEGARTVFIQEALVAGKLHGNRKFQQRLRKVREEIESLEHKLRRVGGLWSDEAVEEFFDERLPAGMCTAKEFSQWCVEHEGRILLEPHDAIREDWDEVKAGALPDVLAHKGSEYPLYYRMAPGEADDGVTIGVHVDELAMFPAWLTGWGVDGMLEERVEALLRSLPKDFRRACQPVSETAAAFTDAWYGIEKDQPLEEAIAAFIRQRTGLHVEPKWFEWDRLPAEWITKVWVCDDEGKELAMGTDVSVLQQKLAPLLKERFEEAAGEEWSQSGLTTWPEEEVPVSTVTGSRTAYPALCDEGESAGVKVFARREEAEQAHRAGCLRLLHLAHPDHVVWLRKNLPLGMEVKFELPRLGAGGTLPELLIAAAGEGALGLPLPRDPQQWAIAVKAARPRWHDALKIVNQSLTRSVEALAAIRPWIEQNRKDRNFGPIAADLEEELAFLLRGKFVWRAGWERLREYDRPLRAMRSRIGRLTSFPVAKDLEKMARVHALWQPWLQKWTSAPDDPRWWDFGWMLEEYRISLFSPDVPVKGKISEKRLAEVWESLSSR